MRLIVILFALAAAIGAGAPKAAAADGTRESFKGWELYAWRDGGETLFALLPGTNRAKPDDEIKRAAVKGLASIKAQLDELKAGQFVTLSGRRLDERPPADLVRDLVEHCKRRGLEVQ